MAERKLTIRMNADTKNLQKGMAQASLSTKKFGTTLQNSVNKMAPGLRKTGIALAGVGAAMTAMSVLAIKAGMDFQKQMANVSTMLDEVSMELMPAYAEGLREMSKEFGESTDTLSKGLYDILSASIAPAKALDVLAVSAKAATAGLTDTGVAADAITTIINSFGMAAEDAGKVSDILFAIVKKGKTTFAELGPSIGKVAATAAIAGLSFEELGATIATVTRAGISTDEAMTSVNGVLRAFLKPTDDAAAAAREFGFELNTNTLRTIGLQGVMELLTEATAEQLAQMFPNIRGLKAIAAAMQDAEGFARDYEFMLNSLGLTEEAFIKQTNTLTFAFEQLKQIVKDIFVGLGEELVSIIQKEVIPVLKRAAMMAGGLGTAFGKLEPESQKFLLALGPLLIALGGFLIILPSLASLMISTGVIIATVLGAIATPIGLLIAMIAGLVIAWKLGWDRISEITSKLVEIVITPILKLVGKKIENFADWIQEQMGIPEEARKGAWELTAITTTIPFFAKLIWKGLKNIAVSIKEWITKKSGLDTPIDELGARIENFFIELPDSIKWTFRIAGRVFEYVALGYGIWWAFSRIIAKLKIPKLSPIKMAINIMLVAGAITIGWDIGKWIQDNVKPVSDFIQKQVDKFRRDNPLLWEEFVTAPLVSSTAILAIAKYISQVVINAIDLGFETATEFIGGLVNKWIIRPIGKAFKDADWSQVWSDFVGGMVWSFKKIWEGIKWEWLKFENLIEAFKQAWRDIDWSWFGFDEVKDFFKNIWESFDWSWLNWKNFVIALQEAWDNTDWGWFGNSIKWLMGLFKKEIEAVDIDIDWPLWPQADKDTKNIIDNINKIADTVEKEIGTKIPKELQLMTVALIASESSFNKNAEATDRLGKKYKGLGQHGEAAIKDLKKLGLTIDDINDPAQSAAATMAYFSEILEDNEGDVKKSILIYKGWGKELAKQGGNIEKMPAEAKKQLDIYLKLLKEFAGDSLFYGTLAGEQFVWGSSPGGVVGEIEEGNKDLQKTLDKMLGSMDSMTKSMSKVFEPIIGIFELIFKGVVNTIKVFDQEAGEEFENFVNNVFALFKGLFGDIEEEAEKTTVKLYPIWKTAYDNLEGLQLRATGDMRSNWQKFIDWLKGIWGGLKGIWKSVWDGITKYVGDSFKRMGEAAADYFSKLENWLGTAIDLFTEVVKGTKTWGEALLELAYSIPLVGGLIKGLVDLAKALWAEFDGSAQAARDMNVVLESIGKTTEYLSEAFKNVGASLTGSINDAERAIRSLMQTQEDLALSTREKLIKELDNYYDYRVLREMDLTELLALSAETRLKLEKGTLEEIAETAEEVAEREKNAKVGTLQAIEDAYAKESKLIDKKIKLIQIEIKLLMAAAEAEQGNLKEAEKLRKEANNDLRNLLYTEEELLEMEKRRTEARGDEKDSWDDVRGATEGATDAAKRYGEEGKGAADDVTDAVEKVEDAFDNVGEAIRETETAEEEAAKEVWAYGEEGRKAGDKLYDSFKDMIKEIREAIKASGGFRIDIGKIPRTIDFDIVGSLDMPDIPRIGDQFFDIFGKYHAPKIPTEEWRSGESIASAQIGIPYIPRTMPVLVHKKEAILTAPQAEQWRAGAAGGGGNVTVNIPRGAVIIYGDIRTKMDEEEFIEQAGTRIGEQVGKEILRTVPL